jgi:hypothetical protein
MYLEFQLLLTERYLTALTLEVLEQKLLVILVYYGQVRVKVR